MDGNYLMTPIANATYYEMSSAEQQFQSNKNFCCAVDAINFAPI